jgi:hypothetical protein
VLCGLSPLYHEYRGSTLNQPEIARTTVQHVMHEDVLNDDI